MKNKLLKLLSSPKFWLLITFLFFQWLSTYWDMN